MTFLGNKIKIFLSICSLFIACHISAEPQTPKNPTVRLRILPRDSVYPSVQRPVVPLHVDSQAISPAEPSGLPARGTFCGKALRWMGILGTAFTLGALTISDRLTHFSSPTAYLYSKKFFSTSLNLENQNAKFKLMRKPMLPHPLDLLTDGEKLSNEIAVFSDDALYGIAKSEANNEGQIKISLFDTNNELLMSFVQLPKLSEQTLFIQNSDGEILAEAHREGTDNSWTIAKMTSLHAPGAADLTASSSTSSVQSWKEVRLNALKNSGRIVHGFESFSQSLVAGGIDHFKIYNVESSNNDPRVLAGLTAYEIFSSAKK
jgi:hypothetical protein